MTGRCFIACMAPASRYMDVPVSRELETGYGGAAPVSWGAEHTHFSTASLRTGGSRQV